MGLPGRSARRLLPTNPTAKWSRIKVPSHWEMEGFVAQTGLAAYQRKFAVPGAWRGKRIKFRAEGIYSKAEVGSDLSG